MSVKAMTWAWMQVCPPASKAVLLALADHADDEGICWPGRKGLAQKLRIDDRNITRHIAKLASMGLIRSEERYRTDGSQTSNLYHLLGVIRLSPPLDENVQPPSAKTSRGLGKNVQPRTVIEPPLEPSTKDVTPIIPLKGDTATSQKTRKKRKPPGLTIMPSTEALLEFIGSEEMIAIKTRFPEVDLDWEAGKCVAWHNDRGGSGNWKLAFKNWLDNTKKGERNNDGRGSEETSTVVNPFAKYG